MILRLLAALTLATTGSLVSSPPMATGGGVTVTVADFAFSPKGVRVPLGTSVTWRFPDSVQHSSTSTQGFWDSGLRSQGGTFTRTFDSSGSYAYRCTPHSDMRGMVRVPLGATGSAGQGYTLRWATDTGSGGTTYDVQVRRPGATKWTNLRSATVKPTTRFNPAVSGTYGVRARTNNGGGGASGYSPVASVRIS